VWAARDPTPPWAWSLENCCTRVGVGANVKEKESNMDTLCSHAGPGAVYAVPVVQRIESQQQFEDEHKSYYKKSKSYSPGELNENGRKKRKKETKPRKKRKEETKPRKRRSDAGKTRK